MKKCVRDAEVLLAELSRLCAHEDELSAASAAKGAHLAQELCSVLNEIRLPPSCDLHAAIAYGYAAMLASAFRSRDSGMARLELSGLKAQMEGRC